MNDTDRLAALLHELRIECRPDWPDCDGRFMNHTDPAERLIAAGVTLAPDTALQKAAQEVVKQAEADEDYDGQFIDYLVSYEVIDALRAALETKP